MGHEECDSAMQFAMTAWRAFAGTFMLRKLLRSLRYFCDILSNSSVGIIYCNECTVGLSFKTLGLFVCIFCNHLVIILDVFSCSL